MPRQVRVEYAGAHYHVLARGNNRQAIFLSDEDRQRFLQLVEEAVEQTGWVVHSYVLMRNHYHLLLETPEPNLVAGMKRFQQAYTQRFNVRHGRTGYLCQGGYKAIPIEEEDEKLVNRVSSRIHLNSFPAQVCGVGCGRGLDNMSGAVTPST